MSYEPDVHQAQTSILRALLFAPHAGFAELQKTTDLTSDHFNFHIKKLVEAGLVTKNDSGYTHYRRAVKNTPIVWIPRKTKLKNSPRFQWH